MVRSRTPNPRNTGTIEQYEQRTPNTEHAFKKWLQWTVCYQSIAQQLILRISSSNRVWSSHFFNWKFRKTLQQQKKTFAYSNRWFGKITKKKKCFFSQFLFGGSFRGIFFFCSFLLWFRNGYDYTYSLLIYCLPNDFSFRNQKKTPKNKTFFFFLLFCSFHCVNWWAMIVAWTGERTSHHHQTIFE